ncbi:MAG: helix-turn-helix domain-containing protein [Pseudomonadota bacterium]|nr:helix-turn-helix domain-containing protein [Pseudomonadota bacterium]
MSFRNLSPGAVAEALGERLRQARLNQDLTQAEVADMAGVGRKTVLNAEKGRATLEVFVAILAALGLTSALDQFLPPQPVSPLQLAKLQGRQRQRASGQHRQQDDEEPPAW